MRKIIFVGIFIFLVSTAHATTYYVGKSGSDANSCATAQSATAGDRKLTVAAGVGCLAAGDTLIVGNGAYTEEISTIPSGSSGAGYTTIQAENNRLATISTTTADGSSTAANAKFPIYLESKAYIRINGFVLVGGESPILIYPEGDHIDVINNTARLGHQSGIKAYRCTNCLFDSNIVYDNSRVNWPRGTSNVNATSWAGGLNLVLGSSSTISNNQIYWNHGEGMSCFRNCVNITMNNNIVADNWSVNVYLDHSNGGIVEGNLVYQSTDARSYAFVGCCNGNNASGIEISAENYGETPILNNVKVRRNIVVNSSVCVLVARNNINVNWTNFEVSGNSCFGNQHGLFIQNSGGTITGFTIKNNLINIAGTDLYSAVLNPNTSGNTLSNNIYQATAQLFSYNGSDTSSYATWTSNSGETTSSYADPGNVDKTYIPPRLWDDGVLSAAPAVSTIDFAKFGLVSGAAAVNAGTATGVTTCTNGGTPDRGAIESLAQPTATTDGAALVIVVENNCGTTMMPASSVTGFSVKRAGGNDVVSSLARTSGATNSFTGVLADAFTGGQSCDFSYAQSTGNVFSAKGFGNVTFNMQEPFNFTDEDCTNLTGGGATLAYVTGRFYLLQGATDTAWVPLAAAATGVTLPPGARINWRFKIANTGDPISVAPRVRVSYDGGGYVTLTSSFVDAVKMLGNGSQLGAVMTEGTAVTQDQLASTHGNVACSYNRSAVATPTLALTANSESECAVAIEFNTSAVAGKVYNFKVYTDAGVEIGGPMAVTIGNYQAFR